MNRNRGRRASGRTRKCHIARDRERSLGADRGEGSGNGEEEEKNEVHGSGAVGEINLVKNLTERRRMLAANF